MTAPTNAPSARTRARTRVRVRVRLRTRISPRTRRHGRPVAAPAVACLAALFTLAACTGDGGTSAPSGGPVASAASPREAAQAFADAVANGDPAPIPFTGSGGAGTMTLLLKGMGELRPQVGVRSADDPDEQATTATARLHYEWPVTDAAGSRWAYDTTLTLAKDGDGWRVALAPDAVAPDLTAGERLTAVSRPGPRGKIIGAAGAVLVTDRPVRRIGIDKARIAATAGGSATSTPATSNPATGSSGPADTRTTGVALVAERQARALAAAVGIDPATYAAQVAASGPSAFVEAIVLRDNDPALPKALAALGAIPGATAISDTLPLAPTSTFARPLLGSVGPATAEIVEQSNGTIKAGDLVGLAGLQRSRQDQLAGKPGHRINALSTDGAARVLFEGRGEPGQDVTTTISLTQQSLAERLLARITGPASAIVAIQPSTGNVLAAASGPGGHGNSTATLGLYPPGSTFKVASALGMLRAGLTPATRVPCTATLTVDGRVFTNYDAYPASGLGSIPLTSAFANSCNTAMISQRDVVGRTRLVEAAGSLGLTADPALGVPAVLGRVPEESSVVGQAAAMIGQGTVQASPLGMATVAASVAAGRTVTARLVLTPPPGGPSAPSGATGASQAPPAPPLTSAEATGLRSLMRAVVTGGSGRLLADLPGAVMAKTGTAEYGDANPPLTHAWMIGIRGDLAVAVFVETGAGGATTAGPLLKAFLAAS